MLTANWDSFALIVHDMVNDRVKPGGRSPDDAYPGMQKVVDNAARVLAACRSRGLPVFYTCHALRADYRDAPLRSVAPEQGIMRDGTWGTQIIDELAPAEQDWLIRKGGGFSAFTGTPLEKWFRRLGIEGFIILGVGTWQGVDSTVRSARDRDFDQIVVVADACTSKGDRRFQEASLLIMSAFAEVVSTDELVAALG